MFNYFYNGRFINITRKFKVEFHGLKFEKSDKLCSKRIVSEIKFKNDVTMFWTYLFLLLCFLKRHFKTL